MRLAIIGGTFNPPHVGHLILAEEILATGDFDKILLIPANIPPHKVPKDDPGPDMRLAMLQESIEGWPSFIVEKCELERKGISYTVDTLKVIYEKYSLVTDKPALVIGDDLALDFMAAWKNPEGILNLTNLVIAHRLYKEEVVLPYPHRYIDNLIIPVSSSLIRERIAKNGAWRTLVTSHVRETIEHYGLYGNTRNYAAS